MQFPVVAVEIKFLLLCRQRERAVRELLALHCPLLETEESARRERFLTDGLLVPESWIHEAKAVRARRDGDRHRQALHLYRAGHWNQCHRLLIQHLASGTTRTPDPTGSRRVT